MRECATLTHSRFQRCCLLVLSTAELALAAMMARHMPMAGFRMFGLLVARCGTTGFGREPKYPCLGQNDAQADAIYELAQLALSSYIPCTWPTPLSKANPLAYPNPLSINPQGVRYAARAATAAAPSW